ncbi:MAG: hypothetical protein KAW49_01125, partial [Anaerolineae bacterium]|nr:hypothetical protein [Anaerolineae bacterium]
SSQGAPAPQWCDGTTIQRGRSTTGNGSNPGDGGTTLLTTTSDGVTAMSGALLAAIDSDVMAM